MEKQSSSDLEAAKQEKTSTSTDGPSQSPETFRLNLIWEEPGIKSYMLELSGELSLHHEFKGPWTKDYFKRLQNLFDCLSLALMERGMDYVDTWIEEDDEKNYNFVQRFGFMDTETLKQVRVGDREFLFRVMRCYFPTDELMEGIRD